MNDNDIGEFLSQPPSAHRVAPRLFSHKRAIVSPAEISVAIQVMFILSQFSLYKSLKYSRTLNHHIRIGYLPTVKMPLKST